MFKYNIYTIFIMLNIILIDVSKMQKIKKENKNKQGTEAGGLKYFTHIYYLPMMENPEKNKKDKEKTKTGEPWYFKHT